MDHSLNLNFQNYCSTILSLSGLTRACGSALLLANLNIKLTVSTLKLLFHCQLQSETKGGLRSK